MESIAGERPAAATLDGARDGNVIQTLRTQMSLFSRINNANSEYLTNSSLSRCENPVAPACWRRTLPTHRWAELRRHNPFLSKGLRKKIQTIVNWQNSPLISTSHLRGSAWQHHPRTAYAGCCLPNPAIIHNSGPSARTIRGWHVPEPMEKGVVVNLSERCANNLKHR